ncbi:MAG: proline dehydrogenase family protein [Chloroflexi bacterium]|nr:proline dehydrogenase family protein [Chloroflexota bacterium]
MLRSILLYLSVAGWAQRIATRNWLARRVARRFVAGETLEESVAVAKALNQDGFRVTFTYLGEAVYREEETRQVVAEYQRVNEVIARENLNAEISLKVTQLGLEIDEEICHNNLRDILNHARERAGTRVVLDMESSPYLEATLRLYRGLREEFGAQVGVAIQAYLFRSAEDLTQLAAPDAVIRIVKGAYLESPAIAFDDKAKVDENYVRLVEQFLSDDGAFLDIATHDEKMITAAQRFIAANEIPPDRYEFQMLYGIRNELQRELVADEPTCVLISFGEEWYPYFVRRLAERPANLVFFLRGLFGR